MLFFKKFFVSGLTLAFVLLLSGCSFFNQQHSSEPLLKKFLFKAPQCLVAEMPDRTLPCGMTTNPYLTTLDTNLDCILKKPLPLGYQIFQETKPELTEAFMAVYKDSNETGYSGFRFKSKADFEAFKTSLKSKIKSDSVSFLFGKNLLFILWKDPGGEACYDYLQQAIPKQLKALALT